MNSALFRRGTRKGCGCTGGSRSVNGQIANLTKSIAYLSKRRNDPLYRRQQAKNNAQIVAQTAKLRELQEQKRIAASNAGIVSTIKNKVQNAVKAVTQQTNQVNQSIARTNNVIQNQPMAVQQAVTTANNAVVAANNAVNKAKQLAALANRANALAKNIRSTIVGGKRNRRTRRK